MKYDFNEITDRSGTASFKYDMRGHIFHTDNVIPMWVADMDFKTPPFIIDALRKRLDHEIMGYSCIMPSFAASACDWILKRHKWQVDPEWVRFTPGVVPAITMAVLAYTKPGEKVIIQPPVYFPFFSIVKDTGRSLVTNPLKYNSGRYSIDFGHLEESASRGAKMMILCSPHNPTGNVWSRADLIRVCDICRKYNILLISDEIHADLVYRGNTHLPAAGLDVDNAGNIITCMSPSKTFNVAGLSTAYIIIKDPVLRARYTREADRCHLAHDNLFGVVAMEAAYGNGHEWLDQLMDYLGGNVDFLAGFIEKNIPQISVVRPDATFMCWLDFSAFRLPQDDLNRLLVNDAGIGLSDGLAFGEEGRGFQRINIGCPRSLLEKALENLYGAISKFIGKY